MAGLLVVAALPRLEGGRCCCRGCWLGSAPHRQHRPHTCHLITAGDCAQSALESVDRVSGGCSQACESAVRRKGENGDQADWLQLGITSQQSHGQGVPGRVWRSVSSTGDFLVFPLNSWLEYCFKSYILYLII